MTNKSDEAQLRDHAMRVAAVMPSDIAQMPVELLAELVCAIERTPVELLTLRDSLQAALLDRTIRHAATQSEFYSHRFRQASCLPMGRNFERRDLERLPLVDKRTIQNASESVTASGLTYGGTKFTSGTSGGMPFGIDWSIEELGAFTCMAECRARGGEEQPATLSFAAVAHGNEMRLPPGYHRVFPVSLSAQGIATAAGLLSNGVTIGGDPQQLTQVSGSLGSLQYVTSKWASEGRHDLAQHVETVTVRGTILTTHAKKVLSAFWQADVVDIFGTTEIVHAALSCAECGEYHFGPLAIEEVLHPHTRDPAPDGFGLLALTALHPWTQMTPFIRYVTGDLVRRTASHCSRGHEGYQFLGRRGACLDLSEQAGFVAFVTTRDLLEVLEPIPDVRRGTHPNWGDRDPMHAAWTPVLELRTEPAQSVIGVELHYPPIRYPERAKEVADKIRSDLEKRQPWLGRLFASGDLLLEVHGPGRLRNPLDVKPT